MIAKLPFHGFCSVFRVEHVYSILAVACLLSPASGDDAGSVRDLIDHSLSEPAAVGWPLASDAEFLRRVSLDLTGMPPSADETRAFLKDQTPEKRTVLIDRLLSSPHHVRHLATSLDVMLMERRPNTHVSQDDWVAWLMESVRRNKPWNVLVRELLTADGEDPAQRASARFLLDRAVEPNAVARDIGRMFFGRDLQCAQCHDSPLVGDFLQQDYQGLLAFTSTLTPTVKKIADKDVTVISERSGTDLSFESVFFKGTAHRTSARVMGETLLVEPFFLPGEDYLTPPADGVRSVPKFSRRSLLAERATNGNNAWFNENAANRIWMLMFGRGLVYPADMMHPENPGVDPVLLRELGRRFAADGFDIRNLLREIANSRTYQRPFDVPNELMHGRPDSNAGGPQLSGSPPELDEAKVAAVDASFEESLGAYHTAEAALIPVAAELDAAKTQYSEALKKVQEAEAALTAARSVLASKSSAAVVLLEVVGALKNAGRTLGDDAELQALSGSLEARSAAMTAEGPGLEAVVNEKAAAVVAPREALAAVRTQVESVQSRVEPLLGALMEADRSVVSARSEASDFTARKTALSLRDAWSGALTSFQNCQQEVSGLTAEESRLAAQALLAAEQLTVLSTAIETERTKVTGMEAAASAKTVEFETAASAARSAANVQASLQEALASTSKAVQLLGGEPVLSECHALLEKRNAQAAAACLEADQRLANADQELQIAQKSVQSALVSLGDAQSALSAAEVAKVAAEQAVDQARQRLAESLANRDRLGQELPSRLADRFILSPLKPLTPEQLCWSVFKVTTVYDRYCTTEKAELDKAAPLTPEQLNDAAVLVDRSFELERRVFDKLKGNLSHYVPIYGGAPGQPQSDFYASADQALFTSNGAAINSWVVAGGDNATERMIKAADMRLAAEELYLGILTRFPDEQEVEAVTRFLSQRPDRNLAAQELVWGLLSSAEFRFNR